MPEAENNGMRVTSRNDLPAGGRVGVYPVPIGSKLRTVECIHCRRPMGITKWEYWNGFLVVCPHCGGNHGKRWALRPTILAGFFFNVVSFLFVFRPRQAVSAILAFALVDLVLLSLSARNDTNTGLMFTSVFVLLFGPVVVNAIALVRHQSLLDKAPPIDPGGRGV